MTEHPALQLQGIRLYLFVSGDSESSLAAYGNIALALETFAPGEFNLEIVNVAEFPQEAVTYAVVLTPTLLAPASARRLIGDLSRWTRVQSFLKSLLHAP